MDQRDMSDPFCSRFGSITEEDAQVIEATLEQLVPLGKVKWLEVGMFRGGTGIGVRNFMEARNVPLEWWGIDAGYITEPSAPFLGANVIKGKSEEVYPLVPNDFDGIFIDGCHCRNHVILDAINYGYKVKFGGFLLFHDTSPFAQGHDKQPCGPDIPEFYISTLTAFTVMGWPLPGWTLFMEKYQDKLPLGGVRSYRKQL
jgi:Methyltransferase domain